MTRPRAADDFPAIRARIEELRRQRTPELKKDTRDTEGSVLGGRGSARGTESRQRLEQDRLPAGSSGRRFGSGR